MGTTIDDIDCLRLNELEDVILECESSVIAADCVAERSGVSHETISCMEKGIGKVCFKRPALARLTVCFLQNIKGFR